MLIEILFRFLHEFVYTATFLSLHKPSNRNLLRKPHQNMPPTWSRVLQGRREKLRERSTNCSMLLKCNWKAEYKSFPTELECSFQWSVPLRGTQTYVSLRTCSRRLKLIIPAIGVQRIHALFHYRLIPKLCTNCQSNWPSVRFSQTFTGKSPHRSAAS